MSQHLRHRVAGPQQTSARSSRTPVVTCRASAKPAEQARPMMELMQRAALGLATAATVTLSAFAPINVGPMATPPAHAKLTSSDGIKNAQTILRYALPIENKAMREIQKDLESISDSLRIPGSKNLGPVERAVRNAIGTLQQNRKQIIADFAPDKKDDGLAALEKLTVSLDEFAKLIDSKDKQEVPIKQREALMYAGEVEEAMVKGFPFAIPKEYQDRPLLLGRATLEMKVRINETPEGPQEAVLTIVLDGYNAPVSAGQFADLVNKKFYDNMEIQRADGFVVQTGDPDGPEEGYVDPKTGKVRRVPFEVRVAGDKEIIYEDTLEDLGRYNDQPALPFNAYGTLAMARSEFENNSASSQVFFLLKESELTPTGANLLDGRYAVFGYVVQGQENLGFLRVGDKIEYIKILRGEDNLKNA